MSLKELLQSMFYTFLIIFSGSILSAHVILLSLFGGGTLSTEFITDMIILAVITNMTQLILLSIKELNRKQVYSRYAVISFLVLIIVISFLFYRGWIDLSSYPTILAIIVLIMTIIGSILLLTVKHMRLSTAAFVDPLTKAYNRRYLMENAAKTLKTCIKSNRDFAVIMFDLDKFKAINDTYGHDVGDDVLKIAVTRTSRVLKSGTVLARYGGEEFILMITDAAEEDVVSIAWRIQKNISLRPFVIGDLRIAVTASFGVASKNSSAQSLKAIMDNSDKALYQAKANGRNMVVCYDGGAASGGY